jgi:hypothetical protein
MGPDPRVDPRPTSRVLSGDEWEAVAVRPGGPAERSDEATGKLSRILTGDEWEQSRSGRP